MGTHSRATAKVKKQQNKKEGNAKITPEQSFQFLDTNQDGILTLDELGRGTSRRSQASGMLDSGDTNGDNTLDFEEWAKFYSR